MVNVSSFPQPSKRQLALDAGNIGLKERHLNMSTICNATISHCLCGAWDYAFQHVFSDADPGKNQCPGLNSVAISATSSAFCKQVSVFSMSLDMDMIMILSFKIMEFARSVISDCAS